MRIEGQRRSEKFEDRGQSGGGGGGGLGQGLFQVVRMLGFKGTLIAGAVLGAVYLFAPAGLKQSLLQALVGGGEQSQTTSPSAGPALALYPRRTSRPVISRASSWLPPRMSGPSAFHKARYPARKSANT